MQDAEEMKRRTRELVMAYLAVGLDPKEVVFFKQSDVPAHAQLCVDFRHYYHHALPDARARIQRCGSKE